MTNKQTNGEPKNSKPAPTSEDMQREKKSYLKFHICSLSVFSLDQKNLENEDLWKSENQARAEQKGRLIEEFSQIPDLQRSDYEFLIKRCHELLHNDAVLMPTQIRSIFQVATAQFKIIFTQEFLSQGNGSVNTPSDNELYFCLRFFACDGAFLQEVYDALVVKLKKKEEMIGAYLEVIESK